jgi:hypothetical protein
MPYMVTLKNKVWIPSSESSTQSPTLRCIFSRIGEAQIHPKLLPVVLDIDVPEIKTSADLPRLTKDSRKTGSPLTKIAQIQPSQHRGVSTNMEKPEKYINNLHGHLTKNNVFLNSGRIFAAAEFFDTIPDRILTSINKIDNTITRGMLMAEI